MTAAVEPKNSKLNRIVLGFNASFAVFWIDRNLVEGRPARIRACMRVVRRAASGGSEIRELEKICRALRAGFEFRRAKKDNYKELLETSLDIRNESCWRLQPIGRV